MLVHHFIVLVLGFGIFGGDDNTEWAGLQSKKTSCSGFCNIPALLKSVDDVVATVDEKSSNSSYFNCLTVMVS